MIVRKQRGTGASVRPTQGDRKHCRWRTWYGSEEEGTRAWDVREQRETWATLCIEQSSKGHSRWQHGMEARRKGEELWTSATGGKHCHEWARSCVVGRAMWSSVSVSPQRDAARKHKTSRRRRIRIQRRQARVLGVAGGSDEALKHDDGQGEMVVRQRHAEASHSLETQDITRPSIAATAKRCRLSRRVSMEAKSRRLHSGIPAKACRCPRSRER
jgi:hypothetical protein